MLKIGSVIVVRHRSRQWNGTNTAPAIVNRIWGSDPDPRNAPVMVNSMALPDCGPAEPFTSVRVFADEAAAEASGDSYFAWPA